MDVFQIHDNTLRRKIFTAISDQFKRINQKEAVNASLAPQDLIQDSMIQRHGMELGTALRTAFQDEKIIQGFIQTFLRVEVNISQQIHQEATLKIGLGRFLERMRSVAD